MNKNLLLLIFSIAILISCKKENKGNTASIPDVVVETESTTNELTIPTSGYETPISYDGMTAIFSDEFDSTVLDDSKWNFQIGTGSNGWGNNELEYYKKENTTFIDGNLIIEAKKENIGSKGYTSSRINTQGKFTMKYGRVDIRAALPKGQGIWPAFWMLGENINTVGWPKCGEIDIMEMIGGQGRENTVHGTLHWDNGGSYASSGGDTQKASLASTFHVYSITWDEAYIRWFIDDVQYSEIDITPSGLSEFHEDFHFLINFAVGGNWPENPDATTTFPQFLIVDYIRAFQEE